MTVRAYNFAPHGMMENFRPILALSVASLDEIYVEHEQNEVWESNVFLQRFYQPFFCSARFDDSNPSRKQGPKFSSGPKLEALRVLCHYHLSHSLIVNCSSASSKLYLKLLIMIVT